MSDHRGGGGSAGAKTQSIAATAGKMTPPPPGSTERDIPGFSLLLPSNLPTSVFPWPSLTGCQQAEEPGKSSL